MAEAADQTVFTVRYDGQTVALRVSKSSKVGEAVREAARRLKVEPHGLTVLHQGLEVPDDRIVEVGARVRAGAAGCTLYGARVCLATYLPAEHVLHWPAPPRSLLAHLFYYNPTFQDLSCAVTVIHLLRRTNHSLRSGMVQPGSLQRRELHHQPLPAPPPPPPLLFPSSSLPDSFLHLLTMPSLPP